MAPTETPTTENEALRKEIGAIEKEMATVKVVIRRASRTRLALLLIALALVGASIWAFYRLAMSFGSQENLNLLAEKARVRANESSKPAINHVRALAENSLPVLREAFSVQVEKDRSKYTETLTRERDLLVKTLESQLDEKIKTALPSDLAEIPGDPAGGISGTGGPETARPDVFERRRHYGAIGRGVLFRQGAQPDRRDEQDVARV